ncbi:hypothetical protein Tco_1018204, partial [Tanacetum coccineum]
DLDEQTEMQCLYLDKIKECERLANELSKNNENVNEECQEQLKNDKLWKQNESSSFRDQIEQYFEIQDLKAQLQDKNIAISELKKLIEKFKGKSVDTKFVKPSVARQPNALRIPKPSVLGKPTTFSDSLKRKDFSKTKTSISRPQLRSTQIKDKVVQNNSQVKLKKMEVEDHLITSLIQIESCKSPTTVLFDVDTERISIVTVNTKEYHSDVLARSQG